MTLSRYTTDTTCTEQRPMQKEPAFAPISCLQKLSVVEHPSGRLSTRRRMAEAAAAPIVAGSFYWLEFEGKTRPAVVLEVREKRALVIF